MIFSDFDRRIAGFRSLKKETLVRVYDNSEKLRIPSEVLLFKQKSFLNYIYIVLGGKLMVARDFYFEKLDKMKTLEIDQLETGDKIGDFCFVFKETLPYSVVSVYPTRLLKIHLDEVKNRLSDDQLMELIDSVKLYPKDDDIIKIFEEKEKWKKYTSDMSTDVHNAKKLAK